MNLKSYLEKNDLRPADMAADVGVSARAVIKWARGERIPRQAAMERIKVATKGEVTPNDFFEATQ